MIAYIDKVLYLYPEIQHVVFWHTQYNGEPWDDSYDGLIWENIEIAKPSKAELDALDDIVVEAELTRRAEVARKAARDAKYATDLSIIANYQAWLVQNAGKTFSDYLDYLESIHL
jgi:hypothetical protein